MRAGTTSSKPSTIGCVKHSARSPPASSTSAAPRCQGSPPSRSSTSWSASREKKQVEPAARRLADLGYARRPAGDFPGRTFLRRIDSRGRVTHHLSVTVKGAGYWSDQLTFRDALRRDPSLVRRYADLKRDLAARSPDRDTYTREKTAFVREILLGAGHAPQTGWASEAPANGA
jgi:hypothetical protein